MTDYTDNKVNEMVPYRNLADEGTVMINGRKCLLGSTDSMIKIKGKDYLVSLGQREELDRLNLEINDLEKQSKKIKLTEYGNYFQLILAEIGITCGVGASTAIAMQGTFDTGLFCVGSVLGIITNGGLICNYLSHRKSYSWAKRDHQKQLEEKKQQKQEFLDDLVK